MDSHKRFKLKFYFFLIFTSIIFVEGFFHMFSRPLSYYILQECLNSYYVFQECFDYKLIYDNEGKNIGITWLELFNYKYHSGLVGFNPYIWNENGLIELLQVTILIVSITVLFKLIKIIKYRKNLLLSFFIYAYLFFLCFFC